MRKLLLVAATSFEIKALEQMLRKEGEWGSRWQLDTLITGVGMTATAFSLGKALTLKPYDFALNVGLAGAFNRSLNIGEVVNVVNDCFSEEGAEDGEEFLDLSDLGLRARDAFPFTENCIEAINSIIAPEEIPFQKVRGITVNTVHGKESSINQVVQAWKPEVESMEGAAFLYACKMEGVHCLQIRAISNYVEKRNKEAWDIPLALTNLTEAVYRLMKERL